MTRPVEPQDADQMLADLSELRLDIVDLLAEMQAFSEQMTVLSAKVQTLRQQIAATSESGGVGDAVDPGNARRRNRGN